MNYITPNWSRACYALANVEWERDVLALSGPRTSRRIRQAKAELRRVEQTEPPITVSA